MPGNEIEVAKFLYRNIGKINLPYLGTLKTVGSPIPSSKGFYQINSLADIRRLSSEDAGKKADIYLNGVGISIKQTGSIFGFNRLQRAEAPALFQQIGFSHVDAMLLRLDKAVKRFHEGGYETRSRPWTELFIEADFKTLLEYLMMQGSPKMGLSKHPAKYIMEAEILSEKDQDQCTLEMYTFDQYFKKYKDNFTIGIRRSWYGQKSDSEHGRAKGLISKPGNAPWVFCSISGTPKDGWRSSVAVKDRRTVYYLMCETQGRVKQKRGKTALRKDSRSLREFG